MINAEFLATVVLLSASGVLTPGPLFLASTLRATRIGGRAGVECAVGHMMVELPLVLGLSLGLSTFLASPAENLAVKLIGVLGGIVLLAFGSLQLRQARSKTVLLQQQNPSAWDTRSGVLVGAVFTGLNPFFILWWLAVGSVLVVQALALAAFSGVLVMYAAHIWMDYAWLGGTATLAGHGRLFLGRWYRSLLALFGFAMLYFGVSFIVSAIV